MNDSRKFLVRSFLCALLASGMAWAGDVPVRGDMSRAEYEAYRAHIQNQLEDVETVSREPAGRALGDNVPTDLESAVKDGYGQGYRARQERSVGVSRMNDGRNGAMNRGGGRNR